MALIKIFRVDDKSADVQIAAARVTFAMGNNDVIYLTQIPPPNECYIPLHLLESAKKIVKKRIMEECEKLRLESLQTKLPY